MKYFIVSFLGAVCMGLLLNPTINDLKKQIQQRDSVNSHNVKVIESLEEYIRLDSLTQLEQLYPKK